MEFSSLLLYRMLLIYFTIVGGLKDFIGKVL